MVSVDACRVVWLFVDGCSGSGHPMNVFVGHDDHAAHQIASWLLLRRVHGRVKWHFVGSFGSTSVLGAAVVTL